MTYDLAFALVWATGDEVLNVNEAHAYASCSNCVTVAVAFQVVLIMDDAQVVVPQNLSVAANYECYRCITAAIASQLVLSVEETPGEEQLRALGEVWGRLTEFGQSITTYSLSEISTRLEAFKAEIVAILGDAPPVLPDATPTPTLSPTGTPTDDTGAASSFGSPSAAPSSAPTPAQSSSSAVSPDSSSPPASSQVPSPGQTTPADPPPAPTTGPTEETSTATQSPEPTTATTTSPALSP